MWDFYYRQNEVAYSQKISDSPLTSIAVNQSMAAIGDAEGTVSIMQLCKALYETSQKEKEVMQQIFEREFRREKNLDVMRRLSTDPKPVKKEKNPEQVAKDREDAMKSKLQDIEEKFFEHVADEQFDVAAIKARGEIVKGDDEGLHHQTTIKIEHVELESGKKYEFKLPTGVFNFVAEAGGIISGDNVNGSVQAGKAIFTAGQDEFEGHFVTKTEIEATMTTAKGETSQVRILMTLK